MAKNRSAPKKPRNGKASRNGRRELPESSESDEGDEESEEELLSPPKKQKATTPGAMKVPAHI